MCSCGRLTRPTFEVHNRNDLQLLAVGAPRQITPVPSGSGVKVLSKFVDCFDGVRPSTPGRGGRQIVRHFSCHLSQVSFGNAEEFRCFRWRKVPDALFRVGRKSAEVVGLKLSRQSGRVPLDERRQLILGLASLNGCSGAH